MAYSEELEAYRKMIAEYRRSAQTVRNVTWTKVLEAIEKQKITAPSPLDPQEMLKEIFESTSYGFGPPAPKEIIAIPREEPMTMRIDFAAVIRQAINGFYLTRGHKPAFVLVPDIYEGALHAWLGVPRGHSSVPVWNGVKILSSPDVTDKVSAQDSDARWDIDLSVEVTYGDRDGKIG